jgi:hypothetical protein
LRRIGCSPISATASRLAPIRWPYELVINLKVAKALGLAVDDAAFSRRQGD